ncbi:MAG: sigma-70 family RNA polymerase sigma factor [Erysipelotrichaceae bacterium]|nr:sigma-70 family RNA polymerase sigma factor [Erysipelotrichaceae bacterium]
MEEILRASMWKGPVVMDDFEIVEMYWDRNEQAISATQDKYGRYCFSIAYNILFNNADSEECLNDTWLHTWNSIPPQRPEKLGAYVGKITRNLALNMYERETAQKRGGRQTELALDELSEVIGKPSDVEENVNLELLKDSINRFLRHESPQNRKVFIQRYWYMCSVKEIARDFGLSESNVKMILSRTREKLREVLAKEGYAV